MRLLKGYYLSKEKNSQMYNDIKKLYEPYIVPDKVGQLIHDASTQKNESMNTLVMYHLPKCRNYSNSNDLYAKLAYVVGINNIGRKEMILRILRRCGITSNLDSIITFFDVEDESKNRKRSREETMEYKKKRIEDRQEKFTEDVKKQIDAENEGAFYHSSSLSSKPKRKKNTRNSKPKKDAPTCIFMEMGCPNKPPHVGYGHKDCKFVGLYKHYQKHCPKKCRSKREFIKNRVIDHLKREATTNATEQQLPPHDVNDVAPDPLLITNPPDKVAPKEPCPNTYHDTRKDHTYRALERVVNEEESSEGNPNSFEIEPQDITKDDNCDDHSSSDHSSSDHSSSDQSSSDQSSSDQSSSDHSLMDDYIESYIGSDDESDTEESISNSFYNPINQTDLL